MENYTNLKSFEDIKEYFKDFNTKVFAFDTETEEGEDSLNFYKQKLEVISFYDGKRGCSIDFLGNPESGEILHFLKSIFEEAKLLIAQNIVFDLGVIYKYGINPISCEYFDTMVADHLLDENKRHGLKLMANEYLDENSITYVLARKEKRERFLQYAIDDARWAFQIGLIQKSRMEEEGLVELFRNIEMPFLKVLLEMKVNGVLIDMERVKKSTQELQNLITDLEIEMLSLIGAKFDLQTNLITKEIQINSQVNLNSAQQLAYILFEKLKLPVIERTPQGSPSVGRITIKKLKDKHEFVGLLEKYKVARKLLSAFFDPLPMHVDPDGRVRPNFRDTGTKTGRLSCSEPNLQQLPNKNGVIDIDTRSCFVVPKGKKMISIDYSQQELRIMAHLSQDPELLKIINNGGDLHLINANTVFDLGIPEEKCYKSHPDYEETKAKYKAERNKGKIFSFGIPYGMGEHKLSKDFNVSLEEAKKLLNKFFNKFPVLQRTIENTHKKVEDCLYVTSMTGRKRRFIKNRWGKIDFGAFRQSFNFLIQGFGADLIRQACCNIQNYFKNVPEAEVKLLMTVHDEVVLECKEEYAESVAKKCEELFEQTTPNGFLVGLKADANIGNNYGEAK